MKIVHTHVHRNDRSAPRRNYNSPKDSCYKEKYFSFKKKCRNDIIIDDIIICCDKNQIAEFDGHRFCNTYGIRSESDYPKTINSDPKNNMRQIRSDSQNTFFMQK